MRWKACFLVAAGVVIASTVAARAQMVIDVPAGAGALPRAIAAARSSAQKPVILQLAPGTHALTEPIVLTPEDSGLTIEGEDAIVSGGRRIGGCRAT